jgi:fumarate hydratase subunit alpha
MREIPVTEICNTLYKCIETASFDLGERELSAIKNAEKKETVPLAKSILGQVVENAKIACEERRPLCQDTGVAVVFIDIGQEVLLTKGNLEKEIHKTVGKAYTDFYLRKSMVAHPFDRKNTNDNTPAVIHTRIVKGDKVKITFDAKGGGCENMSRIAMLPPSAGREGAVDFIVKAIAEAGGNPCPPVVVGVGIGGNFEKAALMAKRSLLRPLGEKSAIEIDADLEEELLEKINATGVGSQGLGGDITALAVHVESHPCHIASLPVAVNLDCHSHRHSEAEI